MNNKKHRLAVVCSALALTACGGNVRHLEVRDSNVVSPKLSVEIPFKERGTWSVSAQTLSVHNERALELHGASQSTGYSGVDREAHIFEYGGIRVSGAELDAEGVNDPRVFAGDATYSWVEGGLYGRFGGTVAFVPGLFMRAGRANFDAVEAGVPSPPATFEVEVKDVSVGASVGAVWQFHQKAGWDVHFAKVNGPGSRDSARIETSLRFNIIDNIDFTYSLFAFSWDDNSDTSSLLLDASGQQLGLIYKFQ